MDCINLTDTGMTKSSEGLMMIGYIPSVSEPYVCTIMKNEKKNLLVGLYVDDILAIEGRTKAVRKLQDKTWKNLFHQRSRSTIFSLN